MAGLGSEVLGSLRVNCGWDYVLRVLYVWLEGCVPSDEGYFCGIQTADLRFFILNGWISLLGYQVNAKTISIGK